MSWFDEEKKQESKYPAALLLPSGVSIVEILGEPEFKDVADMTDKEKQITKAVFPVKYNEQQFSWWMTRTFTKKKDGSPNDTVYAQVAAIASQRGGLTGAVLKITRFGTGKGTRYMIQLS